ncbi:MAG: glycosyltransferase [Thermoleophilia bacterium]
MKVVIAHEWLTSYAGSERVVEQMLEAFPGSPLLTTVMQPERVPATLRGARVSALNRIQLAREHHEWFIPLMPLPWRTLGRVDDDDVVISSSHACSKAVRVGPGVRHVSYCYTPMRYAWDFQQERGRFPAPARGLIGAGMGGLRSWDRRSAARVDSFIAISTSVAERIKRHYGRDAQVIHPPVDTGFFTPGDGEREDFFMVSGRLVAYKEAPLVVEAFRGLDARLVVTGTGPLEAQLRKDAPANVEIRGHVSNDDLRALFRRARALIHMGNEDFGITMVEAIACGCPVIAYAEGGALDIVRPGVNGVLLEHSDIGSIRRAVQGDIPGDPALMSGSVSHLGRARFQEEIVEALRWDASS